MISKIKKFKPLFSSTIKQFVCNKFYLLMIKNFDKKISLQLCQLIYKFFLRKSYIIESYQNQEYVLGLACLKSC
jgi:hypothetical protein